METVLLLHPILDLLVCSPLLKSGHVYVFERKFDSDILTRYVSLGKKDNRLDCMFKKEYIETGIIKLQFEDSNQFFAVHFFCFLKTE